MDNDSCDESGNLQDLPGLREPILHFHNYCDPLQFCTDDHERTRLATMAIQHTTGAQNNRCGGLAVGRFNNSAPFLCCDITLLPIQDTNSAEQWQSRVAIGHESYDVQEFLRVTTVQIPLSAVTVTLQNQRQVPHIQQRIIARFHIIMALELIRFIIRYIVELM